MILVWGKLVWKEHFRNMLIDWVLYENMSCVNGMLQQTDVVLIVFRVLNMWLWIGQKDVRNWKKL